MLCARFGPFAQFDSWYATYGWYSRYQSLLLVDGAAIHVASVGAHHNGRFISIYAVPRKMTDHSS